MWILYAFGSALFAGFTSILAKIGIEDVDSNVATALRTCVVLIFSWLMVLVTGSMQNLSEIDPTSILFLTLSGLTTGASWICYFRALQIGNVNKVVPIDKASVILTMVLAFIILGEPLGILQLISMVLIGVGTYMMIQKKENVEDKSGKHWMLFAVLSAVFASMTSILGKIGIEGINSHFGTAYRTVIVLVMAWVIVFLQKKQGTIKNITKKSWLFLTLSGLATGLSWLCYYKALQDGYASVVVPIDKLSIVVTVLFAYLFLKEKLSKKATLGLMGIIVGTLLLIIK